MSTTPDKKEESESGSESGSGSGSDAGEDVNLDEYENDDEGEIDPTGLMVELLGSTLTTPDGDTICSALVNMGRQLEIQNRILVKLLSNLQKN
jgi:hypothetical protein